MPLIIHTVIELFNNISLQYITPLIVYLITAGFPSTSRLNYTPRFDQTSSHQKTTKVNSNFYLFYISFLLKVLLFLTRGHSHMTSDVFWVFLTYLYKSMTPYVNAPLILSTYKSTFFFNSLEKSFYLFL